MGSICLKEIQIFNHNHTFNLFPESIPSIGYLPINYTDVHLKLALELHQVYATFLAAIRCHIDV